MADLRQPLANGGTHGGDEAQGASRGGLSASSAGAAAHWAFERMESAIERGINAEADALQVRRGMVAHRADAVGLTVWARQGAGCPAGTP